MNKSAHISTLLIIGLLLVVGVWKYFVYFQNRDFYLYDHVPCTEDEKGKCFLDCEDVASCVFESGGYKEVWIKASDIICNDGDECEPFVYNGAMECKVVYCDPEVDEICV